ncbi:hypothetical protein CBM2606_A30421 [Cupriavidus taiwanensis]|nr:hypothetical protein CBM2606_A30421 [Cupriavidus taiwanensis]
MPSSTRGTTVTAAARGARQGCAIACWAAETTTTANAPTVYSLSPHGEREQTRSLSVVVTTRSLGFTPSRTFGLPNAPPRIPSGSPNRAPASHHFLLCIQELAPPPRDLRAGTARAI